MSYHFPKIVRESLDFPLPELNENKGISVELIPPFSFFKLPRNQSVTLHGHVLKMGFWIIYKALAGFRLTETVNFILLYTLATEG